MGFDDAGCSFRGIVGRWESVNPEEAKIWGCCMAMGPLFRRLHAVCTLLAFLFYLAPIEKKIHREVVYSEGLLKLLTAYCAI